MKILVVEDDAVSRAITCEALKSLGYEAIEALDGQHGWALFQAHSFDVVISDWFMPGMDGLELCQRIRELRQERYTYFVLLTVASGLSHASRAMEQGADDFLTKPLDPDELAVRLIVGARLSRLRQKVEESEEKLRVLEEQAVFREPFEGMIGQSPRMLQVFRHLRMAAATTVSVHLHGESGTGKELAARALHSLSSRREGPFLAINCAALPETILESELFGHVAGAFTGAIRHRKGLFELAEGGTLLLDEIGDVSPALQKKLLRVLEERSIRRVGDDEQRSIDVRIVSATHRDLGELVRSGEFREDLFYRVRVFEIDLPSLRDCKSDIALLAQSFIRRFAEEHHKPVERLDPGALRTLLQHSWPGNVRELRNAIEYAFVVATPPTISREDLPPDVVRPARRPSPAATASDRDRAEEVVQAVRAALGNRSEAARILGISRVALWKRIRKLGLEDQLPPSRGSR